MNKLLKNKKGSALVEYGLLIAGVALVSAAAVSVFGHKTNDLIAATATMLPGAHDDDNGAIISGKLVETERDTSGKITLDGNAFADPTRLLGNNIFGATFNGTGTDGNLMGTTLVIEAL
jgi:Flp pilus assembly pilin Flp